MIEKMNQNLKEWWNSAVNMGKVYSIEHWKKLQKWNWRNH